MLYVKDGLDVMTCNQISNEEKAKDSLWLWLRYGEERMIVGCIYRKGRSSRENNEKLGNNIRRARGISDKVLLFGDFNFPEIDWENHLVPEEGRGGGSHEEARNFLNDIDDAFLVQHVYENTRARGRDNPSCLDLILSESEDTVNSVKYLAPLGSSDH